MGAMKDLQIEALEVAEALAGAEYDDPREMLAALYFKGHASGFAAGVQRGRKVEGEFQTDVLRPWVLHAIIPGVGAVTFGRYQSEFDANAVRDAHIARSGGTGATYWVQDTREAEVAA